MEGAILAVSGQRSRLLTCPSHNDQRRHGSEIGNDDRSRLCICRLADLGRSARHESGIGQGWGELAARKSALTPSSPRSSAALLWTTSSTAPPRHACCSAAIPSCSPNRSPASSSSSLPPAWATLSSAREAPHHGLLPGGRPGQPISPCRLAGRLHQIGIHLGPARSTAPFRLATALPAAILASLLGIHIKVAA